MGDVTNEEVEMSIGGCDRYRVGKRLKISSRYGGQLRAECGAWSLSK